MHQVVPDRPPFYSHAVCRLHFGLTTERCREGPLSDGWRFKNQIKFENKSPLHLCLCGLEKQIDFTIYVQYVCAAEIFMGDFFFSPKGNLNNAEREALQLFSTFVIHD